MLAIFLAFIVGGGDSGDGDDICSDGGGGVGAVLVFDAISGACYFKVDIHAFVAEHQKYHPGTYVGIPLSTTK
ncbi:Hypothetical predicted protein [Octopus vulgaris]|uniref:Uncharacterized protein n=1 Tax=Octopus vulgaris TaxID=6645 RepID=A0AA36AVM8_OCTVU|nr:Hypothetical predicted protein [Octopus vulgaris]